MSKERPILFSAPMVNAILAGNKTQTRRIVKPQPDIVANLGTLVARYTPDDERLGRLGQVIPCPYGQPGDWLWVRETWQYYDWTEEGEPCIRFAADNATTWPEPGTEEWSDRLADVWEVLSRDNNFNIDNRARDRRWRPSIHMPRWASRITLEILSVRVERLQEISEADAIEEGISCYDVIIGSYYVNGHIEEHADRFFFEGCDDEGFDDSVDAYAALWESINGAGSWHANPFVWVVSFKRVEQ